jgi:hypothetical protein
VSMKKKKKAEEQAEVEVELPAAEVAEQEAETVKPEPPKAPKVVVLSLEQVALANEKKLQPRFKAQHLPSILAFCKSTGLPTSGTESEMLAVLKKYGYKI